MVRTYWFFPGFYEASGNLGLQPFALTTTSKPCRPRAMSPNCTAATRAPEPNATLWVYMTP